MTISESGLITWTPLEGITTSSGLVTIIVGDNEYEVAQAFVVTVNRLMILQLFHLLHSFCISRRNIYL